MAREATVRVRVGELRDLHAVELDGVGLALNPDLVHVPLADRERRLQGEGLVWFVVDCARAVLRSAVGAPVSSIWTSKPKWTPT